MSLSSPDRERCREEAVPSVSLLLLVLVRWLLGGDGDGGGVSSSESKMVIVSVMAQLFGYPHPGCRSSSCLIREERQGEISRNGPSLILEFLAVELG